jgi:hypothetical protein
MSSSKAYSIEITGDEGNLTIAFGDLDTMAYLARRAEKTMAEAKEGTEFSLNLSEVEHIGGSPVRSLAALKGDADVITYVLRKKLAGERKASEAPAPRTRKAKATETPAAE